MKVDEQVEIISRGTIRIETVEELKSRLKDTKPLTVKLGVDPSTKDLHLGHTIVLKKLRQFQDLGHNIVLIIGDFTGMIGDPSGRSKTRPQLTEKEVEENARTYLEQVGKIIDIKAAKIVKNSTWLSNLDLGEIIQYISKMTVARVLERDDFLNRYKQGIPIGLHEFLYVFLQAYDSVHVRADIELGGNDQLFNILAARDLMRALGMQPQVALIMPILVGTDGDMKMSKSTGNYIGITEPAYEFFAKVMSISDHIMENYFTLLTDIDQKKIKDLTNPTESNQMESKKLLARLIMRDYFDQNTIKKAEEQWINIVSKKETPQEIPNLPIKKSEIKDGKIWIVRLVNITGMTKSNSEARRLIEQGAVEIDGKKITSSKDDVVVKSGAIIKVGKKKKYFKIVLT